MLQAAKSKLSSSIIVQGIAEALPWQTGAFDRLFCLNSFHHFSSKERFIHEARRVIRPKGGILIIGLDPHTGLDRWWIYDYFPQVIDIDRQRYPSTPTIRQMLTAAGFVNCRTVEALHWPVILPAHVALQSGQLAKTSTSQLTLLSDAEYKTGISRLVRDIETVEAKGQVHHISADLRLFATIAWRE
jgi:ubiquinone/menaquinone biosynthesis C-methylase UbiE